ncbi:hypothetical protein HUG17_5329 [Dermatophagoides farinae]|uniref:DUF4211 domain-containing protein n=1 Tax=Dermatophagoides farinae TaxID=6954 RepID=A0A9D4P0P1_DERFA|nr:hypothetical protein HUG17_5329 [Dermatophagoides farinae]
MDPSRWMDPYSHLRQVASSTTTATRNQQLMNNAVCQSQQMMTQNRNGLHHHMAAAAVAAASVNTLPSNNCQQQPAKNLNICNTTKTSQKQQHQMNQYGTKTMNSATCVDHDHQSFINSHHYRSSNCSPWLFPNSRQQQYTNHVDNSSSSSSYDINGHTDNAASNVPSFNSNPFVSTGHLPPPHHHSGVYDPNFAAAAAAAASFAAHQQSQTSKSTANQYLSSMASDLGFMDHTAMTMNNKSNVADNSSNYKSGVNGSTPVEQLQSTKTTAKGMNNMHATSTDSCMDSAPSLRDYHNGFFCPHSLQPPTNGWHHAQNFPNNNGHNLNPSLSNCMTPHGLPTCPSNTNKVNLSTTSNQHLSSNKSHHNNNNKSANNQNMNNSTTNSLNTNNHQQTYQNGNSSSTAALSHSFPNIHPQAPLQSKYDLMQNLSSSMNSTHRNSHNYHHKHQNSLVDPSDLGAKFAQAAAQAHDHYTAACLAAAQAIHHHHQQQNTEYAAFQQQQHHHYNHSSQQQQQQLHTANNVNHKPDSTASHAHHQQYMSSTAMNNAYAAAAAAAHNHHHHNGSNCYHQSSDYPTQTATNFKRGSTNHHQQSFLNYPSSYLFPTMTHPHHADDFPMNSNPFKTHHHSNLFFNDDVYSPCISETNNVYPNHQQQQPQPQHTSSSTSSKSSSKTRKSTLSQKVNNNKLNDLYQPEFVASSTNSCTPTPVANINGNNCCLASQTNTNSNNNTILCNNNNGTSHSRCSSVASTHSGHGQQQQPSIVTNDTYNYNYPSPVTTNLSVHSPFQQTRSSTSNSSHSSINSSCALSTTTTNGSQNIQNNATNGGGTGPEYSNYGTPNSAPPFQTTTTTMGNVSQTPTPTPGYPTPPSSVGHSNSRCNSNEELSPFSNNSMSSNMSHQSYGRNDYNKSTSSCGSQISPKQVNNNIDGTNNMSDSLPNFSSCMVAAAAQQASQQQTNSSQRQQQSSPNLYTSNVLDNNAYKSPQYYSINNGTSVTSMSSNDSVETTSYTNYVDSNKDSTTVVGQLASTTNQTSSTIKLQMDDQTSTLTSYDFTNYSESNSENSFGHNSYPETSKTEISSCSKEPDRPSPHSKQQQPSNIVQTMNMNNTLEPEAVSFETTMDELNFIPATTSTTPTTSTSAAVVVIQNDKSSDNYGNQQQQITTMTYQESSHDTITDSRVIDNESGSTTVAPATNVVMNCGNSIESLIDSLPKTECHLPTVDKSGDTETELMPLEVVQTTDRNTTLTSDDHHHHQHGNSNADSFLSDLAPLMNDNSKIALMESTFKSSNQSLETTVQEHADVANGTTFDKIQKSLFDDHSLPTVEFHHQSNKSPSSQPSMTISGTDEDPDNQFRDVDEFLKSNFKESPVNHQADASISADCKNEFIEGKVISAVPVAHSSKQIDQDSSIQQVPKDQLSTSKVLSALPSSLKTSTSNSQSRKSSSKSSSTNTHLDSTTKGCPENQSNETKQRQKPKTLTNKRKLDAENNNHNNKDDANIKKKSKKENLPDINNKSKSRSHLNDRKSKKTEKNKNSPVELNSNGNCPPSATDKDKQDNIVLKSKKARTVNTQKISSTNYDDSTKSIINLANENQSLGLILPVLSSIMSTTKNSLSKNKNEKKKFTSTQNGNNKKKECSNFEVNDKNLITLSKNEDKKSVKSGKTDKKLAKNNVKPLPSLDNKPKISSCSEVKENCNKNIPTTASTTMTALKSLPILSSDSFSSLSSKTINDKSIPIAPKDISNQIISNIQNSLKMTSINTKKLPISHQQPQLKPKNNCNKKDLSNKKLLKNQSSENKPLLPSPSSTSANKMATTPVAAKVKNDLSNLAQAITTKPRVSLVTNNANQQQALLSPNLFNASQCLNAAKPSAVNPTTLTNVAPTLIVNQGHSVQPYQVSPMTNAVLISIHPANPTPIPSLTAQSFIALNTQSVASSTTSNTTTTATGCSPNSSRRRSQDKKISTIREGLMRTGDFVVAEEESHLELPVIWRIEGKSLLQRFEPSEQNGITIYINTSSYSAWNPTVRQKYLGLDVRIMGCNRTRIVVEKIGLTRNKNERDASSFNEKENNSLPTDSSPSNVTTYVENFEVLIQTLISQALDPNFIAEIVKENDEYFLSHMQTIEEVCHTRRSRFIAKIKWDSVILKNFETYSNIQINKQNNVGDLRCRSCHDNWSTKILYFDGEPYNRDTLEKLSHDTIVAAAADNKKVKIAACDSCTEKIFLYSKLYHHRLNFFLLCKAKVEEIQSKDANKESHIILHECLQDNVWMKKMFQELETLLYTCDSQC